MWQSLRCPEWPVLVVRLTETIEVYNNMRTHDISLRTGIYINRIYIYMLVYCVYMYCLIVFVSVDYMYVCVRLASDLHITTHQQATMAPSREP